ncbi:MULTISPECIES: transketolase family protein [unclassified Achromobacter]|uniref:transketolase family protein n=1 Tax=unclassified Achromobacter TaxID=2626865 RepID=UPI000B515B0A|nr:MULTISPECIES: transketolase C-terminal domain-containing protein [unclassified Achromobacter]OWT74953.1 transketolase [Achromobacter sp. HZ28]OWT76561.1 transketolase [Achromobacter sp. HZ34]
MRAAFSDTLVRLAREDSNVLLLTGDHGYALFDAFRKECPDQYINAGIAEQNMVGMAAGLARAGFRPFVYGLSAFIPVRVVEQIKLDVAHDQLPVIFIGDGAGFVYSHLGTSHQSTEDIACTRAIPDLAVYSPADRHEVSACMELAYQTRGSVYLRMGKSDRGDVHAGPGALTGTDSGQIGRLLPVIPGAVDRQRVSFIATGSMVRTAVDIAREEYPGAPVWSVPFIKPIDEDQVAAICAQSDVVVTLEEHSVHGGLGSLITEIASERAPVRVLRIGVPDRFSAHCGTYDYLLKEHGLERGMVAERIRGYLASATK